MNKKIAKKTINGITKNLPSGFAIKKYIPKKNKVNKKRADKIPNTTVVRFLFGFTIISNLVNTNDENVRILKNA